MKRTFLLVALVAAPAAAQNGLAGSETYTMAVSANAASGAVASETLSGMVSAGLAPDSTKQSSESYDLVAGVLGFDGNLGSGTPVVFGVSPAFGHKTGGDPVSIFGFNLIDGIGPSTVTFAGSPVVPTSATSTELSVMTPSGENAWGNPLAKVDVGVSHLVGTTTTDDAFLYTPALVQETPASVGQTYDVSWKGPEQSFYMVYAGTGFGFGVPVSTIDGSLEIGSPLIKLKSLTFSPSGEAELTFGVPNNPVFAGYLLELQSVALTTLDPLIGSFTNRLEILIQP